MEHPPDSCPVCFEQFKRSSLPLILIKCGHTLCSECIEKIFLKEKKAIVCPLCKQITSVNEISDLPKNRTLLDFMIYHEEIIQENKQSQLLGSKEDLPEEKESGVFNQYRTTFNNLEHTYNKIIQEHSYIENISEVFLIKEVDEVLDGYVKMINDHRKDLHNKIKNEFHIIRLIKDFRSLLNSYRVNIDGFMNRPKKEEMRNNDDIIVENVNEDNSDNFALFLSKKVSEGEELNEDNKISIKENKKPDFLLSSSKIGKGNFNHFPGFDDLESIKAEIKFLELYTITLKNYSKQIYDPSSYLFINKCQKYKLNSEFKKILNKICVFDVEINNYNLNSLNTADHKKILKEIENAMKIRDYKKVKSLFSHFKINPNFICSDEFDILLYQNKSNIIPNKALNISTLSAINQNNQKLPENNLNTQKSNFCFCTNNQKPVEQKILSNPLLGNSTSSSSSLFNNVKQPEQKAPNISHLFQQSINNQQNEQRVIFNNPINSSNNSTLKLLNFEHYLKDTASTNTHIFSFPSNNIDLNELIQFLIKEYDYLPLNLEFTGSNKPIIKLSEKFEWKMNLNQI